MADIGSIVASTLNAMDHKEVVDQVFDAYPLMKMMGDGQPVDGGAQIQKTVRTSSNSSVGARDYREDIPLNEQDPLDLALFDWKFLNGSVVWWDAQEKMNSGKAQIVDFIKELMENGKESLRESLATEQWQDGSGKHFDGIQAIIDIDNTYGGIDRSVAANAYWRAWAGDRTAEFGGASGYKFDTAEPLVVRGGADGGIQHLIYRCSGNGGFDPPDYAACSLALFEKILASYAPKEPKVNQKMADMGFPANVMIGSLTVFYDENAPSGSFSALNTKHCKMKPHTSNAKRFTITPPQNRYSHGQMGKVMLIEYMGNMVCRRPNRCGALTNKT